MSRIKIKKVDKNEWYLGLKGLPFWLNNDPVSTACLECFFCKKRANGKFFCRYYSTPADIDLCIVGNSAYYSIP